MMAGVSRNVAGLNVRDAACRAFPPHHPLIPVDYQLTGQPVLIGGTMGTHSYILTGTQKGMQETFGSTCHGAGRARSRNNSRNKLDYQQVLPLAHGVYLGGRRGEEGFCVIVFLPQTLALGSTAEG